MNNDDFMKWALNKGYINQGQMEDYRTSEFVDYEMFDPYDEKYALIPQAGLAVCESSVNWREGCLEDLCKLKSLQILADYLAEETSRKECVWAFCYDEDDEEKVRESYQNALLEWQEGYYDDYDQIQAIPLEKLKADVQALIDSEK